MKLFLVYYWDYDLSGACAVFSTKEKAQEFINTRNYGPGDYEIMEITLDVPFDHQE